MTWQPIETAPKDGTPIIAWPCDCVFGEDGNIPVYVVCWEEFYQRWQQAADKQYFSAGAPTHWMPLPEPPR